MCSVPGNDAAAEKPTHRKGSMGRKHVNDTKGNPHLVACLACCVFFPVDSCENERGGWVGCGEHDDS